MTRGDLPAALGFSGYVLGTVGERHHAHLFVGVLVVLALVVLFAISFTRGGRS